MLWISVSHRRPKPRLAERFPFWRRSLNFPLPSPQRDSKPKDILVMQRYLLCRTGLGKRVESLYTPTVLRVCVFAYLLGVDG